jgi:serine/threonine protein kinase
MGTWNISNTIDEGGFGKVHVVTDSVSGQQAALKELKSLHPNNVTRFATEIKILQNYNHNHIITVLDSNINGNPPKVGPWYVMEYMNGGSLKTKNAEMFRNGLWAQKWAFENVIFPVLDAMQYAHSHNTHPSYHRDLKPANLLFTNQNHIKVADWGIGKDINRTSITLTVGGMGTPGYCSPEQWFHPSTLGVVDQRTDIYSLGVIFYEMMTGRVPQIFNGATAQQLHVAPPSQFHSSIIQKAPRLDNAILRMMAFDASNRYQTIQQARTELTSIYNLIP